MAGHSDEEALALLPVEPAPTANGRAGRAWKTVLGLAVICGLIAASSWGAAGRSRQTLDDLHFEIKAVGDVTGEAALSPEQATERNGQREQMVVEQDLKAVLRRHVPMLSSTHKQELGSDGESCLEQAEFLFDDVAAASKLEVELEPKELSAFKKRFASAMRSFCKDSIDAETWHEIAGSELERQKPVMTAAMAASINMAGLGFTVKMHSWLMEETVGTLPGRLGLLPTPHGQKDTIKNKPSARQSNADLPVAFRAELKWPECKEAILRIHNQGACGSCWAFGAMASLDARMCIAAAGKWDAPKDILSRLHVTSCGVQEGGDGCQGGYPHWAYEMMARSGIASTSCLPYYIAGEGTEHFEHQDTAPPCETHCQGGYSVPLGNDTFSSVGAGKYNWYTEVHGDPEKTRLTKVAILQEGPVSFAFSANHAFMGYESGVFSVCTGRDQANHAVYAYGWGLAAAADGADPVEYFEASNSWGSAWGVGGHFRIHPRCITDVIIPGPIGSGSVSHQVGTVDPSVPRDESNPYWPWQAPAECPFVDGCVTDLEGAEKYADSEKCESHALDGKRIRVEEFETERGYDVVRINGRAFSGKEGAGLDIDSLSSMTVGSQGIKFQSDFSWNGPGFRICEA